MNILWSKKLINSNCVYTCLYNGTFGVQNSESFFIYGDTPNIMILKEKEETPEILYENISSIDTGLPRNWMVIDNIDTKYLMCDRHVCIDINSGNLLKEVPSDILNKYDHYNLTKKNHETDSFNFGEYTIEHYGNWGYCCKQNGTVVWTFKGRAYLYTDIMKFKDHLYFGTAGMGGYFYILNIQTGKIVLSLKTGGTAFVEVYEGTCYLLTCGNAPELLCIDLLTGTILDRLLLQGRSSVDSCIKLIDGKIYAITFQYKDKNQLSHALLTKVDINRLETVLCSDEKQ